MELIIDFETFDPHLEDLGSGWVYGTLQVIGAGLQVDEGEPFWLTDKEEILSWARKADVIVAHNLQYDLGILYSWGLDLKDKLIIDTIILAKLTDNSLPSYSLDNLSKSLSGSHKFTTSLGEVVLKYGLYQDKNGKAINTTEIKKATKYAYENMNRIYAVAPEVVIEYCLQDIRLTKRLLEQYNLHTIKSWVYRYSDLFKILLKNRKNGVRISLDGLHKASDYLLKLEEEAKVIAADIYGDINFNPNSNKQLADAYSKRRDVPRTAKGNLSITKEWLAEQTDELSIAINRFRHYQKARRDFCDNMLELQSMMPEHMRGRVYPEYNVHGARTGRFSCNKPNLQQIPGRDDELCDIIRGIYIPEDGENWYSLDFSQQEFRIFAHTVFMYCGDSTVSSAYIKNPNTDFYTFVSSVCRLSRDEAKPISLGKLYGMGVGKLAQSLKISVDAARRIVRQYDTKFPSVKKLAGELSDYYKYNKCVITLGGRRLKVEKESDIKGKDYSYRAINYCIQGSASEQIIDAWIALDKAGLNVVVSVHDEMNFSLKTESDAVQAKEIMERACKLGIPMVCEIGGGMSWAHAKKDAKVRKKKETK